MIDRLIKAPSGIGSVKLRIHPPSLNLNEQQMTVIVELINTQEFIIDRQSVIVSGEVLTNYLKGEVTPDTLVTLICSTLNYKLW